MPQEMLSKDRIYVKDLVDVITFFLDHGYEQYGMFNVGTGSSTSWEDVVRIIGYATGKDIETQWMDMPDDIKQTYQYKTKADISNLQSVGYTNKFMNLEEGILDYWTNHWQEHPDILKGYWGNQNK